MKIAVILSGCGVYDGSEIHESVAVLQAIDSQGHQYLLSSINKPQHHVINHFTGETVNGVSRNLLEESARIARGKIIEINQISIADIDAVILPGGFGAAKNLSDYAFKQDNLTVDPELKKFLEDMYRNNKPIGAVCIAPFIIARVFGHKTPLLTIGNDPEVARQIESLGAKHVNCEPGNVVVDSTHRLVTTPAYMVAGRISEVFSGVDNLVRELVKLV